MNTLSRLFLLTRKELVDLWQQRVFVVIAALSPFFVFFCFYLIWAFDVTVPIEVVNEAGEQGQAFVQAMEDIQTPSGKPYLAVSQHSPATLGSQTSTGYMVTVEIPPTFGQLQAGTQEYTVIAHYGAIQENSVKNYINRLLEAESRFLVDNYLGFRPIRVQEIRHYAVDPPVRQAMAVGIMAMALLLAGGIFGGVIVAREYEDRTIKLIRVSPANRALLLVSKGMAALLLTFAAGAIFVLVAAGLLTGAWPMDGWLFLATTSTLSIIGVILGMAAGMVLRGSVPVFISALIANLVMWLLGGGFGSLALYGPLHRATVQVFPFTHGMNLFWHSFFGGGSAPVWVSSVGLGLILLVVLLSLFRATNTALERER
jgi:ABC-2 type transport system permease protein